MDLCSFISHLLATGYENCSLVGSLLKLVVMDQTCPVIHKSRRPQARLKTSVSNSVLKSQYRNRYNTGFSDLNTIPVYSGIEGFSRNIPLPLKKRWVF
jgi:hypothetical protein